MLVIFGSVMILVILALLITNRASPVPLFVVVPFIIALLAGFSLSKTADFMSKGLQDVVGVTALFVFAILYFRVMSDAGMFEPIINGILRFAGSNPVTIALATAVLATAAHLDGSGATTVLITVPPLLPLYKRLGMSKLVLTTIVGLSAGVMNMVPWGGPVTRAGATFHMSPTELWVPMIPVQVVGLAAAYVVAYFLGRREKVRLARLAADRFGNTVTDDAAETPASGSDTSATAAEDRDESLLRPKLFWVNLAVTLATIGFLVSGLLAPEIVFMLALVVAFLINYRSPRLQLELIQKHSRAPVLMTAILLSAGVFLGIGNGTGMFEAIAKALAEAIPQQLATGLPLLIGIIAVPMSIPIEVNAYYFGMLPILAEVVKHVGITPQAMANASMIGMDTVGWPLTPLTGAFFLLVGLGEVNIGAHIRHMLPWAWLVGLVMLVAAVALGRVPLPGL